MHRGDLLEYSLRYDNGAVPESIARKLIRQVLEGLAYLHGLGWIHRDLKMENVMFSRKLKLDNDVFEDSLLRIIDFGS